MRMLLFEVPRGPYKEKCEDGEEKMLFIYNPKAGKGQIKNNLSDIIDIFVKAGNEVTVYPTQYAGDAVRMAAEKSKSTISWSAAAGMERWMKW